MQANPDAYLVINQTPFQGDAWNWKKRIKSKIAFLSYVDFEVLVIEVLVMVVILSIFIIYYFTGFVLV